MVRGLRVTPARPAIRAAARVKETSAPARALHLGQARGQRAAGPQAGLPVAGREPVLAGGTVILLIQHRLQHRRARGGQRRRA
jgi:hypothetical protein